jgi:hypothetical protein
MADRRHQRLVCDIAAVLNLHSRENVSNTPDYILAEYMVGSLEAFEAASNARESWYGVKLEAAAACPVVFQTKTGSKEKAEDI